MRLRTILVFLTLLVSAYTAPALEQDVRRFELTMMVKRTNMMRTVESGE
jgi:hypothetical protein